jgi:hypothetical protein
LPGGDGQPVLVIEHALGRALRFIRSGWTVDVPLFSIPENAYDRWAANLIPAVTADGWLQLRTSGGIQFGSGGGLEPVLYLLSADAELDFITGTTCTPENDESPPGLAGYVSKCHPNSGVLISG